MTTSTLIIIDVEATCDDQGSIPRDESEIIEIGAVAVVLSQPESAVEVTLGETFQCYIQPQLHPCLTQFCSELTGIGQKQVEAAQPLNGALAQLDNWLTAQQADAWGSWGKYDKTQFEQEAALKQLANPLEELPHLNFKQLFARKRKHRVGLQRALMLSGLSFEGRPHSGLDDARNIGRLLLNDELMAQTVVERIVE